MELFFREAALEVTMGGLEGRARDTGRAAAGTHGRGDLGTNQDLYVLFVLHDHKNLNLNMTDWFRR